MFLSFFLFHATKPIACSLHRFDSKSLLHLAVVALQSTLLQKGVRCETRQLPLGDMLWIARRRDDPTSEVLLGYIVERKTASDLASSIIDGRYANAKPFLSFWSVLWSVVVVITPWGFDPLSCDVRTDDFSVPRLFCINFVSRLNAGSPERRQLLSMPAVPICRIPADSSSPFAPWVTGGELARGIFLRFTNATLSILLPLAPPNVNACRCLSVVRSFANLHYRV